jgi:hypothetical protein
MEITQKT